METIDIQSPLPPRPVAEPSPMPESPRTDIPADDTSVSSPTPPTPPKKSLPRFLPFIIGGLALLLVAFLVFKFLLPGLKNKNPETVTLTYWGLWERDEIINGVIADFEAKYPHIKIKYIHSSKDDYRTRLAGRLAKGAGSGEVPDIFRIHSSWLPMFKNNLAPVPAKVASSLALDKDFLPVYRRDLMINQKYYAIPLMYDGLVLFYNKDLIQKAGVDLPKSWWDLQSSLNRLTVRDAAGNIEIAGAALGLADNIDHWSDILGLLMRQNGASLTKNSQDNTAQISSALIYYTNFANKDKTWDETLPSSTTLFAQGKLAFYFAPSWRIFDIQALNPNLSFATAPVPQTPILTGGSGTDSVNLTNINWATYWVEAVNAQSPHQAEAWTFLEYLASPPVLEKLYQTASVDRGFGEIYPRTNLAAKLTTAPYLKAFVDSANTAQSGYLSSFTHDDGLNTELSNYFKDAINALTSHQASESETMTALQNGISQVISKYQLSDDILKP